MSNTQKKRILILGGSRHMVNVVETAKRMGFYTIVIDKETGSPAKSYADKFYDVSTAEIGEVAELAEAEKVDGIFTAFEDVNTWNAQALCEKLGLPFYATKEQLEICSNKDKFKAYCRAYGVPVIEEYPFAGSMDDGTLAGLDFPVIVKPVDSYASQGITVCYNQEEVSKAYQKAIGFSKSGKVIVERFIDTSYGVQMFYTIQNKEVLLTAVVDRHVHQQSKEHPPLPVAMVFPSRHQDQFIHTVDQPIRKMIQGMGIENGVVFIQSLFENGAFYIYEMGFRLSGEQHYRIIEQQTNVNLLGMMLDFAVGEPIDQYDMAKYDNGGLPQPSCNLPILLGNGTIREIIGLEKIIEMPEVISQVLNRTVGDQIEVTGSYGQMFGRFNIVADTEEELWQTVNAIYDQLQILSSEGEDMIVARFSPVEAEKQSS
ncbi:ATP-grasp domain-containing protein [Planococcus shenhongbingii]|uniref:ATP-binding protein n=1 Tax=Planococcus shenhongbingii TaxID=3058398 RepID=UPI00260A69C0|nr:ATP-grasp domain-containing protein [Planococcus sp. N016]WKA57803.1 ATP-grasp domain-containing protein [Planococcus sp. N016]